MIREKDQKIADMEEKSSSLSKSLKSTKQTAREAETELARLLAEKESWLKTRDTLLSQSEKLTATVTELKRKSSLAHETEQKLKMEKSRAEKSLENSFQKENETHEEFLLVSEKLQRTQKDLANAEEQIESLETQLESSCMTRDDLTTQLSDTELKFKKFKIEYKKMEESQTEFASEIYHLTEEKSVLKLKYDENAKALSYSKTALSELGAKHAELQVQWYAEKSVRWEVDEEVSNCRRCSAEFSLLVRRHHCRKCGVIFCWQCSNFTIMMPSSDKPQRVCEACSKS